MFEKVAEEERRCKKPQLLKHLTWVCAACAECSAVDYKSFLRYDVEGSPETIDECWGQDIAP